MSGGKYGSYYFSPVGVHLREGAEKTLLGGAFNRVLGLVAAPVTEPVVDSLLAAFGATPAALNDPDAGGENALLAELAARLDGKSPATPGPHRRMKTALLSMKAAIGAGTKCDADRSLAVAAFVAGLGSHDVRDDDLLPQLGKRPRGRSAEWTAGAPRVR